MEREKLKENKGFSLTELIVVILILSIIAITVYIKVDGASTAIRLHTQAISLANDIRYTQSLSMSLCDRYRLVIVTPKTYEIRNGSNVAITKPGNSSTTISTFDATIGTPTGIVNKIIFNNTGIPYSDIASGTVTEPATTSQVIIPLTARGQTITVTIDPTTGRVTP